MYIQQHLYLVCLLLVAGSRAQDSQFDDQDSLEEGTMSPLVYQSRDGMSSTSYGFMTTATTKSPTTSIFDRFRTKSPATTTTTRSAVELFTLLRKTTVSTTTERVRTTTEQVAGAAGIAGVVTIPAVVRATAATAATGATTTTATTIATNATPANDAPSATAIVAAASTSSSGEATTTTIGNDTKLANANATSTTKQSQVSPTKPNVLHAGLNMKTPSKHSTSTKQLLSSASPQEKLHSALLLIARDVIGESFWPTPTPAAVA
ncbi:hypothetical protein AWZ03_008590 [Drosophila navojoa]|uniref:Uncharacterized protein n=1 Tax=Drosophila navojoa TaxID=7232 RepID=A0A484B8E9_DRONA|nr:hypothetical protein AWZ03_008590 [Drosophila navojoa]